MSDLWGVSLPPSVEQLPEPPREKHVNPCVDLYGRGPEDTYCRTCMYLLRLDYHNQVYLKCEQRKITHGVGTDHRAKWPACAHYEEEK